MEGEERPPYAVKLEVETAEQAIQHPSYKGESREEGDYVSMGGGGRPMLEEVEEGSSAGRTFLTEIETVAFNTALPIVERACRGYERRIHVEEGDRRGNRGARVMENGVTSWTP